MRQEDIILRHLRSYGRIKPRQALEEYGIYRLSSAINRLRNKGYPIETQITNEGKKQYATYVMRGAA